MYLASDKLEENHLPQAMPGRERQLQKLSDALEPATKGKPADSCWEIGPSGVGKTSTAKFLLDEAEAWGVDSVYVSCVSNTRWEALQEIAGEHPTVAPRHNMSKIELADCLAAATVPFVVILDEIGGLEETELLADLADAEWLSLVCIGHRRGNAIGRVPDAVDYLRYAEVVEFDPYDFNALFRILDARREVALQHGVVDDAPLECIVAEAGGSARFGVQALRSAVDLGIDRGHTSGQPDDINDCFEHAHARVRKQQLESLGRVPHLVYRAIRKGGPPRPQRIFERYAAMADDASTRQMVAEYRKKLAEYGLVEHTDNGWVAVDETLSAPQRQAA